MKRIVGSVLALVLIFALAVPVQAAENQFVPSITYKGEPEIIPVMAEEETVIGIVREETQEKEAEDEKIISYIEDPCLVITPVAKAKTSEVIPEQAAETLLYVYEELNSGRMKLPYDKVEGCKPENMVILELLDGSWLCGGELYDHDHPTEVAPKGIVFDITFQLGVAADAKVIVMTYDDESKEWEPIVDVVNNGDGTVKCTFEHFCPIAISVEQPGTEQAPVQSSPMPWAALLGAAAAGIIAIILVLRKKQKKES